MNKRISLIIILSLLAFILPGKTLAYYESTSDGDLRAIVIPENPGPNENVTINLQSYLLNLDTCDYTWTLNSQTAQSGIGQKSLSFQTPGLGQTDTLQLSLSCQDGSSQVKNFVFQSNDADFLTSADTYTPPFYRGGAKPTSKSQLRVVVLPQVFDANGTPISAKELVYKWSKDGKPMLTSSGYGKSAVNIEAEDTGPSNLAVEISTLSGETKVVKSISIPLSQPKLILYENKPLLGIQYQAGLNGSSNLTGEETNIVAEPFFFKDESLSIGNIGLSWYMNSQPITEGISGQSLTLRQAGTQSGQAMIQVVARDSSNPLVNAQNSLQVNFGKKASLFGN